ncbi:GGDEF domain-containing protein [Granulicella sp. WH15]|uniref:GGDEF domain-containing protein n=1 Tax=Granulicella sp. WH15 TaxID=2602070 RepID=UPI0013671CF2|nr:GGDEF domain-containing protein [Granulicella sp. WH15]QHN04495.1 GGDEF domain-containing protein [Granulicella sp. WH15]
MDTRLDLMAVLSIVGSGCLGLIVVRLSNPFLKGLGWLAASFACGTVSAALLLFHERAGPFFTVIVANGLILLAFVLVHSAILELYEKGIRISRFGLVLMGLYLVTHVYFTYVHDSHQMRLVFGSILIAAQATQSGLLLLRPQRGMRMPSWSTAFLCLSFAAYNLVRSVIVAIRGVPQDIFAPSLLQFISIIVMLGSSLGIGFGFFWMTTAKLRHMLERLAATDPLTGVFNRRMFRELCEREVARSLRSGEPFSLLVADLDHFKQVNDRHGHLAGDEVLRAIAECIQSELRSSDILGRWGGEEFVVLLPTCTSETAFAVAERLRVRVEALDLPSRDEEGTPIRVTIRVTISLGVAVFRGSADTLDAVFRRSDMALYRAKRSGRNRVLMLE